MQKVASLHHNIIFKKAFCHVEVFKGFARDFLGIELNIDKVQTEKRFDPPIGNVSSQFDLYAEDIENRVIVGIQHRRDEADYEHFLHDHCATLLEQADISKRKPALRIFTLVVSTSGTREDCAIAEISFNPVNLLTQEKLQKTQHRVLYLSPKNVTETTPEPYREWLKMMRDSLDEQVETSSYQKTEVLKVVSLIKTEALTPQELACLKAAQETILGKEK